MNIFTTLIVIAAILATPLLIMAVARIIVALKTVSMLDRMAVIHAERCDCYDEKDEDEEESEGK